MFPLPLKIFLIVLQRSPGVLSNEVVAKENLDIKHDNHVEVPIEPDKTSAAVDNEKKQPTNWFMKKLISHRKPAASKEESVENKLETQHFQPAQISEVANGQKKEADIKLHAIGKEIISYQILIYSYSDFVFYVDISHQPITQEDNSSSSSSSSEDEDEDEDSLEDEPAPVNRRDLLNQQRQITATSHVTSHTSQNIEKEPALIGDDVETISSLTSFSTAANYPNHYYPDVRLGQHHVNSAAYQSVHVDEEREIDIDMFPEAYIVTKKSSEIDVSDLDRDSDDDEDASEFDDDSVNDSDLEAEDDE